MSANLPGDSLGQIVEERGFYFVATETLEVEVDDPENIDQFFDARVGY